MLKQKGIPKDDFFFLHIGYVMLCFNAIFASSDSFDALITHPCDDFLFFLLTLKTKQYIIELSLEFHIF
jgi:hypothetical protein